MAGISEFPDKNDDDVFRYLIVRPDKGGIWDLLSYSLSGDIDSLVKFLEASDQDAVVVAGGEAADHRWVILVSIVARKILHFLGKHMELTGYVVDFFLNLLSQNGSILGLLYNLLKGEGITNVEFDNQAKTDLCLMASKLAYENAQVVRNVVVNRWKMNFVDFYHCWDDYQKEKSTQVFLLCDKPEDSNLILISIHGTDLFDADDWSTDFDYSWYEILNLGKLHMGFLEALGLGNREDTTSFYHHLQKRSTKHSFSELSTGIGLKGIPLEMVEKTAYYMVREKLKTLLEEHKNAKYIFTGNSLGGALAILFPTVLILHEETVT
ncbi:Autoinhibited H(+)-ATPase isoform 1 [Hibiscus syriacus]|uniref:Autoinhibited H(+)-ATPase isoform 1 n=1 Tax=Hibiscus syriacus TaxID=106335 RepID=A0A6A2XCH7_HIBSY|nr:Autoinhibited H(+)-ATPase isoform 1 [Hibiscus syriacus]